MLFLLHCTLCDHEWQSSEEGEDCDWCGGPSYVLSRPEDDDWSDSLISRLLRQN